MTMAGKRMSSRMRCPERQRTSAAASDSAPHTRLFDTARHPWMDGTARMISNNSRCDTTISVIGRFCSGRSAVCCAASSSSA